MLPILNDTKLLVVKIQIFYF